MEKQETIELEEKKNTKSTTTKKGKHSLEPEEISQVEKALEEAIEAAKQEIIKKAREENKIEIPTIVELLRKAGITETDSLTNKKDTPKREELLSLEDDEELETDEDFEEIEEFEDKEELDEDDDIDEEEDIEEDLEDEYYDEDEELEDEYYDEDEELEDEYYDEEDDEELEDEEEYYEDDEELEEEEYEEPTTRLAKRRDRDIAEIVREEMKKSKKVADVELGKIHSRVFQNICLAIVVMLYLNFVVLGFVNIENSVFATDLKVFSIALLVIAVGIFEYAYKKDSGRHTLHGIEMLLLAFTTMGLIYVNLMWQEKFVYVVALITFIFAIYYVAKSIIVYNKMKKQYFIDEMKKVIKRR